MEYNYLLFENNKLSIKKKERFLQLNQENLDNLKKDYSLISNNEMKGDKSFNSRVAELLKDNEVVINFEKVSSALKELENNKIKAHLSREKFRKISFPIFVQSEYLKNFLKNYGPDFDLSLFLKNSNFHMIELDS